MTENRLPAIIRARYLASAVRPEQYPEGDYPEIAFVGRSNVGKSSLINSLCRHNGLAKTSGTPGKTQTVNFFGVTMKLTADERRELLFVDLPGYGYARTGREAKRRWAKFIEEYLLHSPRLKLVFQLIDIRHPPLASDIDSYHWLTAHHLPVAVIVTKADKLTRSQVQKQLNLIKAGLGLAGGILVHSSLSGAGREELLDGIAQILLQ